MANMGEKCGEIGGLACLELQRGQVGKEKNRYKKWVVGRKSRVE